MAVEIRPSSASTWFHCPGSVAFTRGHQDKGSIYAAEGTAAHLVRATCLELGLDAYDFVGRMVPGDGHLFEFDESWADALQPGIDRIREFRGEMLIEETLSLSPWIKGQGTVDCAVIGKKLIALSDLKFGRGEAVSPIENLQQIIYALGVWKQVARDITDADEFLIIIDQPRNVEGGGEWRVDLETLREWGKRIKEKSREADCGDGERVAGEKQCRWCPGKNMGCPEYNAFNLELIGQSLRDLDALPEDEPDLPQELSPRRRSYILRHRKMIEGWLEILHAQAIDDFKRGLPVPGFKVVHGRKSPATWDDPKKAERALTKALGEDAFSKKLITPAKALSFLAEDKKSLVETLSSRPERKLTLVDEEDPREPIETYRDKLRDLSGDDDDHE